jgi:hypothetical protein
VPFEIVPGEPRGSGLVYYAEVHAAEGGSEPAVSATAEPLAIVLGCGFINPQLQPHVKAESMSAFGEG